MSEQFKVPFVDNDDKIIKLKQFTQDGYILIEEQRHQDGNWLVFNTDYKALWKKADTQIKKNDVIAEMLGLK